MSGEGFPVECPGEAAGCGPHPLSAPNPHHAEQRRRRREADVLRSRMGVLRKRIRKAPVSRQEPAE